MSASRFQILLLREMELDVWYDTHPELELGGKKLPDWFYHRTSQPMVTLRAMQDHGMLDVRPHQDWWQVMRPRRSKWDFEQLHEKLRQFYGMHHEQPAHEWSRASRELRDAARTIWPDVKEPDYRISNPPSEQETKP